jgi:hypothetical protein
MAKEFTFMRFGLRLCFAGLLWSLLASLVSGPAGNQELLAQETRLPSGLTVGFASVARAREILTNRDEFLRALSPFDRAARMRIEKAPSDEEFCGFLTTNVLAWDSAETNRLGGLVRVLRAKVEPLHLPLPSRIDLVKTTGKEEGGAAYTRQSAILLPRKEAASASVDLLAHELFHVLSRNNPDLRRSLYRVIGFQTIPEVELPDELRPIRITNPDGVHHDAMIQVKVDGDTRPVVPVLFSSSAKYDPARGGEFFDFLLFRLLVLESRDGRYSPVQIQGKAQLLEPREVSGFDEQIGKNTSYIIHPDEILADNFVFLMNGRTNLPTPRIVNEMRGVFQRRAGIE